MRNDRQPMKFFILLQGLHVFYRPVESPCILYVGIPVPWFPSCGTLISRHKVLLAAGRSVRRETALLPFNIAMRLNGFSFSYLHSQEVVVVSSVFVSTSFNVFCVSFQGILLQK